MSKRLTPQDATGVITHIPGLGILQAYGSTVPVDNTAGYAIGCLFHKTNGGNGTALYLNEGTALLSDFNAIDPA